MRTAVSARFHSINFPASGKTQYSGAGALSALVSIQLISQRVGRWRLLKRHSRPGRGVSIQLISQRVGRIVDGNGPREMPYGVSIQLISQRVGRLWLDSLSQKPLRVSIQLISQRVGRLCSRAHRCLPCVLFPFN